MRFYSMCRERSLDNREIGGFLNVSPNFQQGSYHLQGLGLTSAMFLLADEGNITLHSPLGGSLQRNCLQRKNTQ